MEAVASGIARLEESAAVRAKSGTAAPLRRNLIRLPASNQTDTLAARYGRRALAVLTVSDHLLTGDALPSDQRETSFGDMVEIALQSAFE